MEKFAVIKVNNSQYKVSEGDVIEVDKLAGKAGDKLKFNEVLLKAEKDNVVVGTPIIKDSEVSVEIIEQFKGEKVESLTYKAKARTRRRFGSRKELTKLKILKIN
ncbi:MAG TPA: 50S ribosomal protein L21 [Candidatus Dojkabacteria bacterium]|nr:50S ribosomal protein L21 [Candidatus Dojkabacteria bacterium]HRO64884.1 50S ribosomal protein L21 [Candidatus Dojkabacteria bacterium]HRP36902.1 50S ribosomal protein L21 [Candidatus Dojkabacteria bacterium]HRP51732.1 50S ribosomal protein L21 [Candidatus Dojkabacteria bacterium]